MFLLFGECNFPVAIVDLASTVSSQATLNQIGLYGIGFAYPTRLAGYKNRGYKRYWAPSASSDFRWIAVPSVWGGHVWIVYGVDTYGYMGPCLNRHPGLDIYTTRVSNLVVSIQ